MSTRKEDLIFKRLEALDEQKELKKDGVSTRIRQVDNFGKEFTVTKVISKTKTPKRKGKIVIRRKRKTVKKTRLPKAVSRRRVVSRRRAIVKEFASNRESLANRILTNPRSSPINRRKALRMLDRLFEQRRSELNG